MLLKSLKNQVKKFTPIKKVIDERNLYAHHSEKLYEENVKLNDDIIKLKQENQLLMQMNADKVQYNAESGEMSYSSWGEDKVLSFIFKNHPSGFYVDIGAYHPEYASNTKVLFDKGWSGINVDANQEMINRFKDYRPNDINLNLAIANNDQETVDYYVFDEWATSNTISDEFKETFVNQGINVSNIVKLPCLKLGKVLDTYLPTDIKQVDFMSIDVETFDYEVLQSNDWNKYIPTVIAIEDFDLRLQSSNSKIYHFLTELGYELFSVTLYTCFYVYKDRKATLHF